MEKIECKHINILSTGLIAYCEACGLDMVSMPEEDPDGF